MSWSVYAFLALLGLLVTSEVYYLVKRKREEKQEQTKTKKD